MENGSETGSTLIDSDFARDGFDDEGDQNTEEDLVYLKDACLG